MLFMFLAHLLGFAIAIKILLFDFLGELLNILHLQIPKVFQQ